MEFHSTSSDHTAVSNNSLSETLVYLNRLGAIINSALHV